MTETVVVTNHFDASPDLVWEHVRTPRLLQQVAAPLIEFKPIDPPVWPERWEVGDYLCAMKFYGVLPIGRQTISISFPEPEGETRFLRDNGHSAMIRKWDHWLSVTPEGNGTRYEDRLTLDAGWRTPFVAAFARVFYRHRQARWQKLIAGEFRQGEAA